MARFGAFFVICMAAMPIAAIAQDLDIKSGNTWRRTCASDPPSHLCAGYVASMLDLNALYGAAGRQKTAAASRGLAPACGATTKDGPCRRIG